LETKNEENSRQHEQSRIKNMNLQEYFSEEEIEKMMLDNPLFTMPVPPKR
jgi:non-homologous end joining protein Ku